MAPTTTRQHAPRKAVHLSSERNTEAMLTARFHELLFKRHPEFLTRRPENFRAYAREVGAVLLVMTQSLNQSDKLGMAVHSFIKSHLWTSVGQRGMEDVGLAMLDVLEEAVMGQWGDTSRDAVELLYAHLSHKVLRECAGSTETPKAWFGSRPSGLDSTSPPHHHVGYSGPSEARTRPPIRDETLPVRPRRIKSGEIKRSRRHSREIVLGTNPGFKAVNLPEHLQSPSKKSAPPPARQPAGRAPSMRTQPMPALGQKPQSLEALVSKPRVTPASKYFEHGRSMLNSQQWRRALEDFKRAMHKDPDKIAYKAYYAWAGFKLGVLPRAEFLKVFKRLFSSLGTGAERCSKDEATLNLLMGNLLRVEGDFERATEFYRRARYADASCYEASQALQELSSPMTNGRDPSSSWIKKLFG